MLSTVDVECRTPDCRAREKPRRVWLRAVALNVVELPRLVCQLCGMDMWRRDVALQVCLDCTTAYSAGAPKCPHCGSQRWAEEGSDMAKITVHGGPSNRNDPAPPTGPVVESVVVEVAEPEPVEDPVEVPVEVVADEPADEPDTVEEETSTEGPYAGLLRSDLVELCRSRGIASYGTKDDLLARLASADA